MSPKEREHSAKIRRDLSRSGLADPTWARYSCPWHRRPAREPM